MSISLVTGATGNVGGAIARALAAAKRPFRCLVRNIDAATPMLPPEAELVLGDLTDEASVIAAAKGCDTIFHAGGRVEQWTLDSNLFDNINVGGTINIPKATKLHGITSLVYTSTLKRRL